jgi:hypothetical protein
MEEELSSTGICNSLFILCFSALLPVNKPRLSTSQLIFETFVVGAQHAVPLLGNSRALVLALKDEVRERGERARKLGIGVAIEARFGALRVVLR